MSSAKTTDSDCGLARIAKLNGCMSSACREPPQRQIGRPRQVDRGHLKCPDQGQKRARPTRYGAVGAHALADAARIRPQLLPAPFPAPDRPLGRAVVAAEAL